MRNASSLGWTCFVIAGFAAIIPNLHADDKPAPTDSDGYKMVPIVGADGKRTLIRVPAPPQQDSRLSSSNSDGAYEPDQFNLSKTSSFANKSFSSAGASLSQSSSADEQRTFITKPYFADNASPSNQAAPGFNTKAAYPVTNAYNRTAPGLDKSYAAGLTDAAQNKSAQFTAGVSEDQNRTANLDAHKIDTYASSLADKTYNGPEVDLERHDLAKLSQGLMEIKDLPNRPLTIDEVRDLINHGIKPNTDAPPAPPSKPLNDPDYKPEPAPAPPPPDPSDEGIPSPGAMAVPQQPPPENSEPLPK